MAGYLHIVYTSQVEATYTVFPPPTVSSVSPNQGPEAGGTAVTITGTDFQAPGAGTNAVTFGGVAATSVVTVNDTTITCVTPAGTGTVDVVVTNGNGPSAPLVNGYKYVPGQGEVTLRRDRDLTASLQLEERNVVLRQRSIEQNMQLGQKTVTLRRDRDLTAPIQLKTRRPG